MFNFKNKDLKDMAIMDVEGGNVVLFHPHIPKSAFNELRDTLNTRWIGQGPKVELFEKRFSELFASGRKCVGVGSGTDAMHLAYILSGLKAGDEVVTPLFTCTATNIPFLYMGVKIKFADVQIDTLNINIEHVRELMNEKTKAIVCVHYGGLPCDMQELREIADEWEVPIIEDAAHALGAKYKGKFIGSISEFTMFSFQAIKHITTGDGGMLILKDPGLCDKAFRLRWFGIDRKAKQGGIWEHNIKEVGYKYQMTDIAASLGLASLEEFDETLSYRRTLFTQYEKSLNNIPGLKFVGGGYTDREHAAWLCTVIVENRFELQRKLRENGIESNQVHFRNDRYTIFEESRYGDFPNMCAVEDKYLVLPLHTHMTGEDADRVCSTIKSGW